MLGFHPSGDQEAEAMEEKQAGDKWMRMVPLPPLPWRVFLAEMQKPVWKGHQATQGIAFPAAMLPEIQKQPRSLGNLA